MNAPHSLDDLRSSLAHHAEALASGVGVDHATLRAGIARARRRRAVVATGASLVLALTLFATLGIPRLTHDDAPDSTRVAETPPTMNPPARTMALGLPYALVEAERTESRSITFEVDAVGVNGPLVSWSSTSSDAEITVSTSDGILVWGSTEQGFSDHVVLDVIGSDSVTLTSTVPGLSAALYERDFEQDVVGFNQDGFQFRDEVGSDRLIGAAVSDPGTWMVDLSVPDVGGEVRLVALCEGFSGDAFLAVSPTDGIHQFGSCSASTFTGDVGGITVPTNPSAAGGATEFIAAVSDAPGADLSSSATGALAKPRGLTPESRVAIAAYEVASPRHGADVFSDLELPATMSSHGHVWGLEIQHTSVGAAPVEFDLDPDETWMAGAHQFSPGGAEEMGLRILADGVPRPSPGGVTHTRTVVSNLLLPLGTSRVSLASDKLPEEDSRALRVWKLID